MKRLRDESPPVNVARFANLVRRPEKKLPVFERAAEILECIQQNDVTLIQGDTGCGKTSGVPHILLRAALHSLSESLGGPELAESLPSIVVTQPRRVAATSLAARVADQLLKDKPFVCKLLSAGKVNYGVGGLVGYRVRFDDRSSPATRIAFVTDGLLIRECLMSHRGDNDGDICDSFNRYDYIVIDEAHERSVRIDQLLGMCRVALACNARRGTRRKSFKLIIMSATLDHETLRNFYVSEPLIKTGGLTIPGKMFPVQVYYMRSPAEDLIEACVAAVCEVMVSSSEGDILVFLPGAEEILSLKRLLAEKIATLSEFRTQFNVVKRIVAAAKKDPKTHSILFHSDPESPERAAHLEAFFGARFSNEEQQALASALAAEDNSRTVVVWSSSNDTETAQNWVETEWLLLPLFAALSADEQSKVFAPPNSLRERKIILSTNIAETSLTLPNARYVVDSGKVKQKFASSLKTVNISKAMAIQRSGRAGRVAPGVAYRLMTEPDFGSLEPQSLPEIRRCDLAEYALDLLTLDGDKGRLKRFLAQPLDEPLDMLQFPLPAAPGDSAVRDAKRLLTQLGVIQGPLEELTKRGHLLCRLPLPVLWGNFVIESIARGCLAEAVVITAMLSLDVVWFPPLASGDKNNDRIIQTRRRILHPDSDHIGLLQLFLAWKQSRDPRHFCRLVQVDERNLARADQVRRQLKMMIMSCPDFGVEAFSSVLTSAEDEAGRLKGQDEIKLALLSAMPMNIAIRLDEKTPSGMDQAVTYVLEKTREKVMLHPSATFFTFAKVRPACLVFSSLVETNQKYARDVSAIEPSWVLQLRGRKETLA